MKLLELIKPKEWHFIAFLILFSDISFFATVSKAQKSPEWIVYNCSNMPNSICNQSIYSFKIDRFNNKWIIFGLGNYLVRYDDITFTIYPFQIPSDISTVGSICSIDTNGGVWFSHYEGVGVFRNNIYSYYYSAYNFQGFDIDNKNRLVISSNFGPPYEFISTLEIRSTEDFTYFGSYPEANYRPGNIKCLKNNDTWINNYVRSIVCVRNDTVSVFDTSFTHTPYLFFTDASSDFYDNVWFSNYDYVSKFENNQFTVFDSTNSCIKLPARSIACDLDNIIWIGTYNGLVKFDGVNCQLFNSQNSPMPYNVVEEIYVDNFNNKWFTNGTHPTVGKNLVVYREGGVMLNTSHTEISEQTFYVYPNPAGAEINVTVPVMNNNSGGIETEPNGYLISIYDVQGRLQQSVVAKGPNTLIDISLLSQGVYTCIVSNDKYRSTVKVIKM